MLLKNTVVIIQHFEFNDFQTMLVSHLRAILTFSLLLFRLAMFPDEIFTFSESIASKGGNVTKVQVMRYKYLSARDFRECFCFYNTDILFVPFSLVYSTAEEGAATLPPCLDKHEDKNFPVWMMEKNDRRGPNSLH